MQRDRSEIRQISHLFDRQRQIDERLKGVGGVATPAARQRTSQLANEYIYKHHDTLRIALEYGQT